LIADGLQTLTVAPLFLRWMGPVSVFLALLVTLDRASDKLVRSVWLVGLGHFATRVSVVYVSIRDHGNTTTPNTVAMMDLLCGWLVGLGLFATGVSWVYVSISEHGNTSTPIAIVLMVLFVAGLALFHALAFWFWGKLAKQSQIRRLILFPAIWVLGDWLRGWF